MDYQKIYDDFIRDRRADESRPKYSDEYMERHHIIPRSMGGDDSEENLIYLTHRDHYFAHCCLAKIHGGGMWLALEMMSSWVSKTHGRAYTFTQSRLAGIARELYWKENRKWTKRALLAEADKYDSVSEFKERSPNAYAAICRKPYGSDVLSSMSRKHKISGHWDLKTCMADAAKYETRIQWHKSSSYAYKKALDCGWMEKCSAHMKSNKGEDKKKAVINLTTGDSFDSLRAAAKQFKLNENAIGNVLAGRAKKCGGFEWKYA